jgi:PadR family transcriptional regulator, regulatory protein PadR
VGIDLITTNDYALRNMIGSRRIVDKKALQREILLGFWKVHILHHAAEKPVIGQWMIQELRHHGYEVSPGTIYPLLARLEERGWLKCKKDPDRGLKDRKEYSLTENGREALAILKKQIAALYREVVLGEEEEQ